MENKTYVYPSSQSSAKQNGELEEYQESYELNIKCTDSIEKAIEKTFDGKQGYSLSPETAKEVIEEFGFDRVNYVLSNTLQQLKHDGRFSHKNKDWSKEIFVPVDKVGTVDRRKDFVVSSHPAVLDGFINLARKEYQNLELWGNKHCNSTIGLDFKGKIMVLHPSNLKDEYRNPRDQLVYTTGGFGCSPTASGRKVYGKFISDNDECVHGRTDFIGELKEEHHSEWLVEKLEEMGIVYVNLETKENELLELISDTFDEQEQQDFNAFLKERVATISTDHKINLALAVKNESYTIYREVEDDLDVGEKYVSEEYAELDDIIKDNLDYEGIVVELSVCGGKMTDVGFILECTRHPESSYKPSEIDTMLKKYELKLEQGQSPTM